MMQPKENIPLFKKWTHWYLLLVIVLLALIVFFSWFTKYFS
ncbi:MAG TPA: hypothetical protein PL045_00535 [Chitinophagaceae bacterium]|nr:hypothetical protein [Chitinophagaceae bacterium]